MKNLILSIICLLVLTACENNKLGNIKKGMSQEEVVEKVGQADEKHQLGSGTDLKTGEDIQIEIWYYWDNQSISFSNQVVSSVDLNTKKTTKDLLNMRED